MKWIGERISFVNEKGRTSIVISPEKSALTSAMLGAWFFMWIAIGVIMIWSFFKLTLSDQEKIIIVVFLVFWAYYAIRVGRVFFWLLWGKEMIRIDEKGVTIKNSVRNYGKSTIYFVENIKNLRINQPKERSIQAVWEKSPWIRGGERLEFDYVGKLVRFGKKLEEKELKVLFNLIHKKIDEQRRVKRD